MSLKQRTVLEKRGRLDGGCWLSREGNSIKISYDYAGRVTKKNQRFSVDEIKELAAFVRETDEALESIQPQVGRHP